MKKNKLVGRDNEIRKLKTATQLSRNVLIEGPVGVGKTFLVEKIFEKNQFIRVDGDSRYTEQKLSGWYDPPIVLKKGYVKEAFLEGPLIQAMQEGKVLFINELNRMPETVQNVLLPAMDERKIIVPRFGEIKAQKGFLVIATQNPKEFTATYSLSEALLDRFELLKLHYQSREEEIEILEDFSSQKESSTIEKIVDLVRQTRNHATFKRGASVRAALAVLEFMEKGLSFSEAALFALPTRVELISPDENIFEVLKDLIEKKENLEKKK